MKSIFITGTAGSGKSLLTSKIHDYYTRNGAFCSILNLDPGVESLPYAPDVDVRDLVDIVSIMKKYSLGPNGSLIMANDLIASKVDYLHEQIEKVNPDYLIIDTPGQIELFAYRMSGPFMVQSLGSNEKINIFLFDGALVTTPINFVSITLLATSINLRLKIPTINALTKMDIIGDNLKKILRWSSNPGFLEEEISKDSDGESYSLTTDILRSLNLSGLSQGLIPISNVTGEGMVNLETALSRILSLGEELED